MINLLLFKIFYSLYRILNYLAIKCYEIYWKQLKDIK